VNEIIEIECGEPVWSLAFGSNKSFVKHSHGADSTKTSVYTRFHFTEHHLILAVGLASGKIRIYDALNGRFLFGLFDHGAAVRDLKFTRDGSLQLASASRDTTVKLWNMYDDGNMYKTLRGHTGNGPISVDWSPTDRLLCTAGSARQVFIWNTQNFTVVHSLKGHLHDVVKCEFAPDGALLATASFDTKVCLWDPYSGQLIRELCHLLPRPSFIYAGGFNEHHVRSMAFSSKGDHLVTICDDK
jgi:WD repeat/SOCS box-containing protein 1